MSGIFRVVDHRGHLISVHSDPCSATVVAEAYEDARVEYPDGRPLLAHVVHHHDGLRP